MPRRRSAVLFAVVGAIALIAASPTFAAKGGIPIAGLPVEEIVAAAEESEGSNPNYPREPVILPEADLVYIDVYIGASSGGGKGGGGGNQGGGNGNKPN